jgi:CBS domain-containing protein
MKYFQSGALSDVVAEILAKMEFYALPVCEDQLLVGIITTTDLINYLLAQYYKKA